MKINHAFLVLISLLFAQNLAAQTNYISSSTSSTQSTLNLFHNSELKLGNTTSITDRARCILKFGDGDYVKIGEWEGDDWLSFKASCFNFTGSLFVNTGNIYVNNGGFLTSAGTTGSVRFFYHDTYKHTYIDYSGNAYFRVTTVGTPSLVLESTGNVGIGYPTSYTPGATHVPTGYKLGVNGNVICEALKVNTGINTNSFNLATNPGLNKILVSDASGNGSWSALSSIIPAMSFNGSEVGIGVMPPTAGEYNLYVTKGILAEAVTIKLQANWPDYVFAKDYKLNTLKEVETFISKNKHLPDLPSAETVKKEGINLGEMNAILLKKIEELTLYVINQQKQIDELKESVRK